MGLFDNFPYTNFHELNLDWILNAIKELTQNINNFETINEIKYADPIEWNINRQYEANTIVIDNEIAYISKQEVPAGISIANDDYWLEVFDLSTLDKTNALTPDNFEGTDYEKLQSCIDYAIDNYYPTIIINRKYDITGHQLKINKGEYISNDDYYRYRGDLTFIGINNGGITKRDSGFIFTADFRSAYIQFINMKFNGEIVQLSTMTDAEIILARQNGCSVFDCSMLFRITTIGCEYQLLNNVFDGTNCTAPSISAISNVSFGDRAAYINAFYVVGYIWDCKMIGCICEVCNYGVRDTVDPTGTLSVTALHITNTIIEGTEAGPAIYFDVNNHNYSIVKNLVVDSCYMENCMNGCLDLTYNTAQGISIKNNYLDLNTAPYSTYNAIAIKNNEDSLIIEGNTILTGAYGIYCTAVNYENCFFFNKFVQVGGVGSFTNSNKAITNPILKTYQGTVTTESLTGNGTHLINITDFGDITMVKATIPVSWLPNTTYNTRLDFVNYAIDNVRVHTYGTDTQTYDIKYTVIGY